MDSPKKEKQNTIAMLHAGQWLQIVGDVLNQGPQYGIAAQTVNYQNNAALIRLPGLRVCPGTGTGVHLVFLCDMRPDGRCEACYQKIS